MLPGRRRGFGRWTAIENDDEENNPELPAAVLVEDEEATISGIHTDKDISSSKTKSGAASAGSKGGTGDGLNIRVLDVKGQTYKLVVYPNTAVIELKRQLAEESNVEVERQRIIHMGKVLNDTDTMQQLKVREGTALHLFQRPKDIPRPVSTVSVPVEGHVLGTAVGHSSSYSHGMAGTSSVREIPHLVIDGNDFASMMDGGGTWELESARRGMRFLGSFLFLVSTMQALEALAIITAAPPDKDDDYHVPIEVYLIFIRSLLGCGVGALGVRGSHNMERHILQLYFWGLLITAVFAVVIRIEILWDVITGKLPENVPASDNASSMTSSTSAASPASSLFESEAAEASSASQSGVVDEAGERSDYIFSAFLGTLLPAMVWFYCVIKARSYARIIQEHGPQPPSRASRNNSSSGNGGSGGGGGGGGGSNGSGSRSSHNGAAVGQAQPVVTGRVISRSVNVDRGVVMV